MNERTLVSLIQSKLRAENDSVILGIGDDAAIVHGARQTLFCSDAMVESVHFDLSYTTPSQLGHKALATCLSDLAAMNGLPIAAVVTLALPKTMDVKKFIADFYEGAGALAASLSFDIVGGDLSSSPGPIFVDVACLGKTTAPKLRSTAKPRQVIAVSGELGSSAAGLQVLKSKILDREHFANRHLLPMPRFDLVGTAERTEHMTSLIDVSDGLATELSRIAEASQLGFTIDVEKLPIHPQLKFLATETGADWKDWALFGGEDYELLATFEEGAKLPCGFTAIGETSPNPAVKIALSNGTEIDLAKRIGFDHFASLRSRGFGLD